MKSIRYLRGGFASLAFAAATLTASAQAPNLYQVFINGYSWRTNANGVVAQQPLNNTTLLRDLARQNGTTDYSSWALAYHVRGSDLGDTIDVVDKRTGTVLDTLFGFYFGQDFGRTAILSGSRRQGKRLEYIYTDQNSHSLGSVLLTTYYFFGTNGNINSISVLGQMQWVVTPDAHHDRTQIASASLRTGKPWQFPSK